MSFVIIRANIEVVDGASSFDIAVFSASDRFTVA